MCDVYMLIAAAERWFCLRGPQIIGLTRSFPAIRQGALTGPFQYLRSYKML